MPQSFSRSRSTITANTNTSSTNPTATSSAPPTAAGECGTPSSSSSAAIRSTSSSPSILTSIGNIVVGGGDNHQQKSFPSILSRKRKAECLETNMNITNYFKSSIRPSASSSSSTTASAAASFVIGSGDSSDSDIEILTSSENHPPPAAPPKLESRFSMNSNNVVLMQSSRMPLSTLQTSNSNPQQQQQQQLSSSNFGPLSQQQQSSSSSSSSKRTSPPKQQRFHNQQQKRVLSRDAGPPQSKKIRMRESWSQFREFIHTPALVDETRTVSRFPPLKWADREEMWRLICKKETGMYVREDEKAVLERHPAIQPRMRAILFDWLIEVCEVYKLHRETFYLAVDYIDRYLSVTKEVPKTRLQLIGVTCLFIGAKIEEIYPPKLSEFAYVTDGACAEEEILTMELVVLKELKWGLSPMTPNGWMKMYMQISNCDATAANGGESFVIPQFSGLPFSRIMQLLDLCILDMGSLSFRYSVLAASALFHSHTDADRGREVALDASGYSWPDIVACVEWMTPFVAALREETPLQPRSFANIKIENQHNIQTHTVELAVLDKAQERQMELMEQEDQEDEEEDQEITSSTKVPMDHHSGMPKTPIRSQLEQLAMMTPPTACGDIRYSTSVDCSPSSSNSNSSSTNARFLTPRSLSSQTKNSSDSFHTESLMMQQSSSSSS